MAVCWIILRWQQIYTVIQTVHSLLYIVAKCNLFSVVTWKDLIKYLQKCEGFTHFCEILYIYNFSKYKSSILKCHFKSNQITFIVTSPQHKCLGEWNSYERAPDSAKKNKKTIYIWTDSAKKNCTGAFTVLQTVQKKTKNNLHMDSTYLQTVQKTMCKIHIHILSTHSVLKRHTQLSATHVQYLYIM